MRRREFITLLCGAAAAWPPAARAQQSERVRRMGVLHPQAADDAERQAYLAAFRQELERLAGPTAAIFKLTTDGARATPQTRANMLQSWLR